MTLSLVLSGVACLIAGCEEPLPACTGEDCGIGGAGAGGGPLGPECIALGVQCGPPSCRGAAHSCGPNGDEDCCASLEVPAGSFYRSSTLSQPPSLSDPASVSAFRLDRFEVTVGRFRRFVEAYPASKPQPGAGAHPLISGTGWDPAWDSKLPAGAEEWNELLACSTEMNTWTPAPGEGESVPLNCLSWYAAFAFCAWDGGRLPTDAEWLYAAVGGQEQRYYPWTTSPSDIDPSRAVYGCTGDGVEESNGMEVCTLADIPRVGSRSPAGDGRWGQADMAGSVNEWHLDWYSQSHPNPCSDCAYLGGGLSRARRGGHWGQGKTLLLSYVRFPGGPETLSSITGVRCARPLAPAGK